MMGVVFFISFLAVFYAYFGYPLLLRLLIEVQPVKPLPVQDPESTLPALAVIITVRNEESVIEEKIRATLALEYNGKTVAEGLSTENAGIELIVASDASDDRTDEIVRGFAADGVRLVRLEHRGGKETAQKAAVQRTAADIIVFTDAKIRLEGDVLQRFVRYFADEKVGAVSSTDHVEADEGTSSGEGFYVRYEMRLRELESQFNSLVGLSGSCFAVRSCLCGAMATDIPSDFALLIEAQRQGFRGVHAPDVIGTYKAVRTEREEFSRKVRTVLRGITTLMSRREVMDVSKFGLFAWQMISHKLMRWLVPLFSITAALSSFALMSSSIVFHYVSLLILGFLTCAAIGFFSEEARHNKYFKIPLFYVLTNAAIAVAWIKYFGGSRAVVWDPSAKGK
jgi:cellulose synthase/poly-beta-1,6-N-acetylglucosamine synthase-like glycosyltransferase